MSEKKITFNPEAVKKSSDTKKAKKEKPQKKKKQKEVGSTRSIRFVKRKVSNFITYFFYTSFLLMVVVSFLLLSKMSYLTNIAEQKAISPTKIAEEVQLVNSQKEEVVYHAKEFVKVLFTFDKTNQKEREEILSQYLVRGLNQSQFTNAIGEGSRTIESIELLNSRISEKQEDLLYNVTFSVRFKENDEPYQTEITLTCSYQNNDFKIVNYPTYLNSKNSENKKENPSYYTDNDFYTEGQPIRDEDKEKVTNFVTDFFKLYAKNDENLKLISNVKGLEKATMKNVTIKNIVEKNEQLVVEGIFTFTYQESSENSSFFRLQLRKTKDTYFVESISS